jgi:hypothetical protein
VENGNWIARADGETDLKADPRGGWQAEILKIRDMVLVKACGVA